MSFEFGAGYIAPHSQRRQVIRRPIDVARHPQPFGLSVAGCNDVVPCSPTKRQLPPPVCDELDLTWPHTEAAGATAAQGGRRHRPFVDQTPAGLSTKALHARVSAVAVSDARKKLPPPPPSSIASISEGDDVVDAPFSSGGTAGLSSAGLSTARIHSLRVYASPSCARESTVQAHLRPPPQRVVSGVWVHPHHGRGTAASWSIADAGEADGEGITAEGRGYIAEPISPSPGFHYSPTTAIAAASMQRVQTGRRVVSQSSTQARGQVQPRGRTSPTFSSRSTVGRLQQQASGDPRNVGEWASAGRLQQQGRKDTSLW